MLHMPQADVLFEVSDTQSNPLRQTRPKRREEPPWRWSRKRRGWCRREDAGEELKHTIAALSMPGVIRSTGTTA